MSRLSFENAKRRYVHRYTMDHIPAWARQDYEGAYYAPQYHTDLEWYEGTRFPGEPGLHGNNKHCESGPKSWPLGRGFLKEPFHLNQEQKAMPFNEINT